MGARTANGSKGRPRAEPITSAPVPRDQRVAPTPPVGVVAERFAIDGVEMVAFHWETASPPPALTSAESAVLDHLLQGASNADIARARGASPRTVANQVASLLRKLGVASRYELMARYGGGL